MRRVVDILILLMIAALAGGGVWYCLQRSNHDQQVQAVRLAVEQFQQQIPLKADLDESSRSGLTFPRAIEPFWFETPPMHALAVGHPWVDIAPEGDRGSHPPDPVLESPAQAGFWYNPRTGMIRARVPRQYTEQQTLALYNSINGTGMTMLPVLTPDERQARATTPNPYSPLPADKPIAAPSPGDNLAGPAPQAPSRPTLHAVEASTPSHIALHRDPMDAPLSAAEKPRPTLHNAVK